jgi:DNA-binding phage protein
MVLCKRREGIASLRKSVRVGAAIWFVQVRDDATATLRQYGNPNLSSMLRIWHTRGLLRSGKLDIRRENNAV